MRMFLVSVAALFLLAGAYSPASAAAAPALAKKPVNGQAHSLVEKAHGWKRRYYRPRVYGYYYRPIAIGAGDGAAVITVRGSTAITIAPTATGARDGVVAAGGKTAAIRMVSEEIPAPI